MTPGAYDIESIERLDEKGGWLYFIASPDNLTQRYLFRTRLDGKGNAERMTPRDLLGTNSYNISPEANWAFHTYSNIDLPPATVLVQLPQHVVVRELAGNKALRAKARSFKKKPSEFFRVNIGGVELDGWMIKPYDFDPKKRYPVLFHVYGEPAGQTVLDRWGGRNKLWHLMLAQQGYVVISVDNRAPRRHASRLAKNCLSSNRHSRLRKIKPRLAASFGAGRLSIRRSSAFGAGAAAAR
jgi:dipeptidyl-peptidase-4